jgi:hypothetical protein
VMDPAGPRDVTALQVLELAHKSTLARLLL